MNARDLRRSKSTLGQDFRIFADGGFLVTLVLLLALFAAATAAMIYASEKWGIPVLRM